MVEAAWLEKPRDRRGECGVSGVSMVCGAGMAWLRSVAIFLIEFFVLYPNESEVTVGLGSDKRATMSLTD